MSAIADYTSLACFGHRAVSAGGLTGLYSTSGTPVMPGQDGLRFRLARHPPLPLQSTLETPRRPTVLLLSLFKKV